MSLESLGYLRQYTNTPARLHMVEPTWNRKNNGRWTKRPKETTRQMIQKN